MEIQRAPSPRRLAAVVCLVLIADALCGLAGYGLSLKSAAGHLKTASVALKHGELNAAKAELVAAALAARDTNTLYDHPLLGAFASLPGARDDLAALNALAGAARASAFAGLEVARAASAIGAGDGGLASAVYSGGRIDFAAVETLDAAAARSRPWLERARSLLESAPEGTSGPIARALDGAGAKVQEAIRGLDRARLAFATLPRLAARGTERRYLLAFQSPSEARGSGGLIGVYGVLAADDGKIELTEVEPARKLVPTLRGRVGAPTWYESLYGPFGGTRDFRQANLSPAFPTVAKVLLRMYERAQGERLDGVIAVDPVVFGRLVAASGSLKIYGYDRRIGRHNASRVLMHDIYVDFEGREGAQNGYLKRLVAHLWGKLSSGDVKVGALIRALSDSAAGQRLKMFATDDEMQDSLAALGIDGSYERAGDNVQIVYNNNFSANKVDYFMHRKVASTVRLEGQSAVVQSTVTLANRAPAGDEASILTRPGIEKHLPPGLNRMTLGMLLPRTAVLRSWSVNGADAAHFAGREGDRPVEWGLLEVPAGRVARLEVTYEIPNAALGDSFEFTLWPQAAARPDSYSLTIVPSRGTPLTRSGLLEAPVTASLQIGR